MHDSVWIIVPFLLALAAVLSVLRMSLIYWIGATAATLLIAPLFLYISPGMLFVVWIVFGLFLLCFAIIPVRRNILSRPIKKALKGVVPHISSTEEEALLAGTVWWDGELFSGKPDWRKITGLPKAEEFKANCPNTEPLFPPQL